VEGASEPRGNEAAAGKPIPFAEDVPADLPFWLDFGVPVGSSALFLFVLWILTMVLLWQL
jgi:hypothetical protein